MSEDRTSEFFALANSYSESSSLTEGTRISSTPAPTPTTTMTTTDPLSKKPSFHSQPTVPLSNTSTTTNSAAYAELRTFHSTASEISRDIAATSAMLSELTQLVRRRGLFVDDTDRVNYLVLRIKSNIENLNGRLDEAGKVIAQQKRRLGKNSQAGQEASNLVGQLKEEFVQATTNFKTVLQQRSDRMKEQNDRKMQVFGKSLSAGVGAGGDVVGGGGGKDHETVGLLSLGTRPRVYPNGNGGGGTGGSQQQNQGMPTLDLTTPFLQSRSMTPSGESTSSASQLPRPRGVSDTPSSLYTSDSGLRLRHSASDPPPPLTPLEIQRHESTSTSAQTLQLIPDQNYLRERADAMTTVEANIVELGTIFNKLAVMVSEHREMVQRVEDNVEDSSENMTLSMAQLTDTLENLRTNKQLFMKVLSVIVVFIILFITFFA